jgi:hypothetical protein
MIIQVLLVSVSRYYSYQAKEKNQSLVADGHDIYMQMFYKKNIRESSNINGVLSMDSSIRPNRLRRVLEYQGRKDNHSMLESIVKTT